MPVTSPGFCARALSKTDAVGVDGHRPRPTRRSNLSIMSAGCIGFGQQAARVVLNSGPLTNRPGSSFVSRSERVHRYPALRVIFVQDGVGHSVRLEGGGVHHLVQQALNVIESPSLREDSYERSMLRSIRLDPDLYSSSNTRFAASKSPRLTQTWSPIPKATSRTNALLACVSFSSSSHRKTCACSVPA